MIMKPIKIFITSWFRPDFTYRVIREIKDRTKTPHEIHVLDNGSNEETVEMLLGMFRWGTIQSLSLNSRNTGCLYGKIVFHAMTEEDDDFYVVTDNDIIPPRLSPDWLEQMLEIMRKHPDIGVLAQQMPPVWLQAPYAYEDNVAFCQAVGNTFKVVRRKAFPALPQRMESYGDDAEACKEMAAKGWKSAFARNIFCYNLELDQPDWGYAKEQLAQDPRKAGYGPPFKYVPTNWDTLRPPEDLVGKP